MKDKNILQMHGQDAEFLHFTIVMYVHYNIQSVNLPLGFKGSNGGKGFGSPEV